MRLVVEHPAHQGSRLGCGQPSAEDSRVDQDRHEFALRGGTGPGPRGQGAQPLDRGSRGARGAEPVQSRTGLQPQPEVRRFRARHGKLSGGFQYLGRLRGGEEQCERHVRHDRGALSVRGQQLVRLDGVAEHGRDAGVLLRLGQGRQERAALRAVGRELPQGTAKAVDREGRVPATQQVVSGLAQHSGRPGPLAGTDLQEVGDDPIGRRTRLVEQLGSAAVHLAAVGEGQAVLGDLSYAVP